MKIDRGLLFTLAAAALTAACASAGGTGTGGGGSGGVGGSRVALPQLTCAPGVLANHPSVDSAAVTLALADAGADSADAAQYVRARESAGRGIAANPNNAYAYYLAGQAAVAAGDYADADSLLRRTLELCPALGAEGADQQRLLAASRSFDRAQALLQANDTASALSAYQTALSLDPANYPSEFYVGLIAFSRQQTDEAVRHWRRVGTIVDALPADSSAEVMANRTNARVNAINALTFAARQYLEREQTDQAFALLSELIRLMPNNADVAYNYALALNTQQRWRELLPAAQRAVELAPLSYGALVLYYNGYAGQSQQADSAGQRTQAQELARQATLVRQRHDSLPVQIEAVQAEVEGESTTVRGVAVGTGQTAPVTLEFTLHGFEGPVGTGTVTVTPPASQQQQRFDLTIANSAEVLGVTYRVVGGAGSGTR